MPAVASAPVEIPERQAQPWPDPPLLPVDRTWGERSWVDRRAHRQRRVLQQRRAESLPWLLALEARTSVGRTPADQRTAPGYWEEREAAATMARLPARKEAIQQAALTWFPESSLAVAARSAAR